MEDFNTLKDWGVTGIDVQYPEVKLTSLTGTELGAVMLDTGPEYHLELDLDSEGFNRLKNALGNTPRTDEEEVKHELKVMNDVMGCEGNTIHEKMDNYFDKVDKKVEKMQVEYAGRIKRYKIRHR